MVMGTRRRVQKVIQLMTNKWGTVSKPVRYGVTTLVQLLVLVWNSIDKLQKNVSQLKKADDCLHINGAESKVESEETVSSETLVVMAKYKLQIGIKLPITEDNLANQAAMVNKRWILSSSISRSAIINEDSNLRGEHFTGTQSFKC